MKSIGGFIQRTGAMHKWKTIWSGLCTSIAEKLMCSMAAACADKGEFEWLSLLNHWLN